MAFKSVTLSLIVLVLFIQPAFAQESPAAVPGEYLIKFKSSAGGVALGHGKLAGKAQLKASFPAMGMMQVSFKADQESLNVEELRQDPDVEYIEPNYILKAFDEELNSDIKAFSTSDYVYYNNISRNPYVYSQTKSTDFGISKTWSVLTPATSNSNKIVVAVIDTGLDKNHRVFRPTADGGTGALWINEMEARGRAGVDDDFNGYVDDINGWNFINNNNNFADSGNHGTHVAGIVVGAGQNIFSDYLQESSIQVMPLKFLGTDGGSTSNAIRAIYYAVNQGARVINNSWGGSGYSRSLHEALVYAYNHRVLVVSAAGNSSLNNDVKPTYPASYDVPSNLAVASVNSVDKLSSFSNYGYYSVHVGSPGERVASTIPGGDSIGEMSGTSMAAPFVSGVAALALRESPHLSGYQLRELVLETATLSEYLNGIVNTSSRVEPINIVKSSQEMVFSSTSPQPDYTPQFRGPASGGGGAGGCGLVRSITQDGPGKGGPTHPMGIIAGLLMLPLVLWQIMRTRASHTRRRFERFKMQSEIRVNVGNRELVGSVNTISEGGLSFNVDEAIEKGGIVTMQIASPDGSEVIQVQGRVVWNEANQAYGVQFDNARSGALAMIRDWTSSLVKVK